MDQLRDFRLVLVLLLSTVCCSEDLEPVLKAVGDSIEMGFCFGVDYIVGYKLTSTGQQLVGNSSGESLTKLDGRVRVTNHITSLLGLEISNLTAADSGVYLRQCWRDNQLITEMKHYLYVCGEEAATQDISISPDGGARFSCETSRTGMPGTSIRWYREVYPKYKTTLFLDTQLSLEPIQPELQGEIEVGAGAVALHIPASVMKESRNFHCLVLKQDQCLAFQNIELPESEEPDVKTVYRSLGESVRLRCPTKHPKGKKYWETPFGRVDANTPTEAAGKNHLSVQDGEASGGYVLEVSHLTENHTGDYKCFAPLLTADYAVTICPKHDSVIEEVKVGGDVVMSCMPQEGSFSVQWYRQDGPDQETLLADSGDPSIEFLKDLAGRAVFSETHTLTITSLTPEDNRKYWCVILEEGEFPDEDYAESGGVDIDGEGKEEDADLDADGNPAGDYGEDFGTGWEDVDTCLSRREIQLKIVDNRDPDPRGPDPRDPDPQEPGDDDAEPATNPAVFGIVGGVIGLLVLGAVIAAVFKLRSKQKQDAPVKVPVKNDGEMTRLEPENNKP